MSLLDSGFTVLAYILRVYMYKLLQILFNKLIEVTLNFAICQNSDNVIGAGFCIYTMTKEEVASLQCGSGK